MAPQIHVDPALVQRYVLDFAKFGAYGESGVWRTVYSPDWVAAQNQYAAWCQAAGLDVRWDAVGNVWGRLEGSEGGPSIVSGSHVDSQRPGGRYDGALGALGGLIALRTLKEQFGTPKRTLEAVSLCEEESSRFPAANFWGSRAATGAINPGEAEELRGYDDETIGDAMRSVGLDPARIREAIRDDIDVFIELHIEQGPILEQTGVPAAIVTAINGIRQYVVELVGRSDHAGGMPMDLRRDPMAGAAEIISGVVGAASRLGRPAVTTVGRVLVEPNFPAIIPDRVTFTIDARHPDPVTRDWLYAQHESTIRAVAERRCLGASWHIAAETAPSLCDPHLVQVLKQAADEQGIPFIEMVSGAVHDSQRMARIAKIAMVFVQSKDGRSHTPAEYTSPEHAAAGIRILAAGLHRLAY